MTGNGKHTTYKNGESLGMVYCLTHMTLEIESALGSAVSSGLYLPGGDSALFAVKGERAARSVIGSMINRLLGFTNRG